jgi:fumarylacetoacetase
VTTTWVDVPADDPFGIDHLPYGCAGDTHGRTRAVVRIGNYALDLTRATSATEHERLFADGSLDALLAAGAPTWATVRALVIEWLTDGERRAAIEPLLTPLDSTELRLPFTVADFVDFYASENHATNVGRLFRPDGDPLTPNWKHLPIGYHGRSGTVVVSGTDVRRPSGQARDPDGSIRFGPSQRLDIEAEVAFVVGVGSTLGNAVSVRDLGAHVFGVSLLNDWSARDIQAWEYVPLGPFLGKSFATSVSAWVTPLAALADAWVTPPPRDPQPLPYLDDTTHASGLDLELEVRLNATVISRPPFATMYWTPAQMLAHMTVNGASLRTGDLFASGTVSGAEPGQRGSLLELTENGSEPISLADGTRRAFLEDGDEVVITASARAPHGRIGLGEVRGRIVA